MNILIVIWQSIVKRLNFWNRLKVQDKKHDNPSNTNSGQGATPDNKEIRVVIRDGIGLFASGTFAGVFFASSHFVLGLWCSFVSLVAAFDIPFHYASITKPSRCRTFRTLQVALMAGVAIWFVIWSYRIANHGPTTNESGGWQPPELSAGCNVAYFYFGKRTWKVPINNYSLFTLPIPSWFVLKNHRICLQGDFHFFMGTNIERITIDNLSMMDSRTQPDYEWNFSSDAFEVVNQEHSPIFQLIYLRPNVIRMNGIFITIGSPLVKRIVPNGEPVKAWVVFGTNEDIVTTTNNADMRAYLHRYDSLRLFNYPAFEHRGQFATPTTSAPNNVTVQQPDYVEGTKFTREQLQRLFPFGYAVIYLNADGEKEIQVFRNKLLDWKIDWDNLTIEPKFSDGIVMWRIPPISAEGTGIDAKFENSYLNLIAKLQVGWLGKSPVFTIPNKPAIYALTLSDDQRKPVFALGFRIPMPKEDAPSNQ